MAFWLCSSSWRESFWEKVRKLFPDVRPFYQLEMLTTGKFKARKDSNTVSNKFTIKMFVDYQLEMLMTGKLNKKVNNIVNSKLSYKVTIKVTYIVTNKVTIKMYVRSLSWKCI
jgi:hypothetical protein